MADKFVGTLTGVDSTDQTKERILLQADSADVVVGGAATNGKLELRNTTDKISVSLGNGETGDLYLRDKNGNFTVALRAVESGYAGMWVGGQGRYGLVTLRNSSGKDTVNLGNGETGDLYLRDNNGNFTVALRAVESGYAGIWVGGQGRYGLVTLRNSSGKDTVNLGNGETGDLYLRDNNGNFTVALRAVESGYAGIWVGGQGRYGLVTLRNSSGKDTVNLGNGETGDLYLRDNNGNFTVALRAVEDGYAGIWVGGQGRYGLVTLRNSSGKDTVNLGNGETGDLYLRDNNGDFTVALRAVENGYAGIWVGGHRRYGLVTLRNSSGKDTVNLGNGETGDLYLRNNNGEFTVALRAVEDDMAGMWIGGSGQNGHVIVRDAAGTNRIHLDGKAGDIILANADCAEEFEIVGDALPGTVMSIGDHGRLVPSAQAYDRRVAGIISGAGESQPGIVLGRTADGGKRRPIALVGRVGCRVDARESPIEIGDLLTTSVEPGHAMRATDPARAFGAVIGKALQRLDEGKGLIPVLVALQ